MAYRNTIISLASLVAFGTACSKAPSYDQATKTGSAQTATATDEHGAAVGHGDAVPTGDKVATAEPKTETPAPVVEKKPDPAAPGTPAAPAATAPKTDAEKAKIIATQGFAVYAVNADNGVGFNTAATPFLIGQTVNAAGAIDTAKPVNVILCNVRATGNMTLHSGNGGPMAHGQAFPPAPLGANETLASKQAELEKKSLAEIQAMPNCKAHLVNSLNANAGATYNHQGGAQGNAASHVFFKMFTVDAAGVVTAK